MLCITYVCPQLNTTAVTPYRQQYEMIQRSRLNTQSVPGQGRLNTISQRAKHKVRQNIGYLMKTKVLFVERFEMPNKRIMFHLIRKMKINCSISGRSTEKGCAEVVFS